jgi:hypothetical protein
MRRGKDTRTGKVQMLLRLLTVAFLFWHVTGIALAEDPASANREAIYRVLWNLSLRAQKYYYTRVAENGGQGDFSALTLAQIANGFENAYGDFTLSSAGSSSVTLTGDGIEVGNDGATAVEVQVIVYADSVNFTITN